MRLIRRAYDSIFGRTRAKQAEHAGAPSADSQPRPSCTCLDPQYKDRRWSTLALHAERQDTNCDAWKRLLELVEQAADDGREEFVLAGDEWDQVVTLPPTISRLKAVKHLMLYGSGLVRVPPEIGEMSSLEKFTPYTSYRLHWFPYEITRCANLKKSCVSTRALYGNYKYRPPFPQLPDISPDITPRSCSICNGPFTELGPLQVWISLKVATDTLPLLVHACSSRCISNLPPPAQKYVSKPHCGGFDLVQPEQDQFYR